MIDTRGWPTIVPLSLYIYIYIRAFNGGKIGFGLSHDEGRFSLSSEITARSRPPTLPSVPLLSFPLIFPTAISRSATADVSRLPR